MSFTDAVEEGSMSALEEYFAHLRDLDLVTQIVLSDFHGRTIISVFDTGLPSSPESNNYESNVVLSGARLYSSLDQLEMDKPEYIHAQFHNHIAVQLMKGNCLLSVIGSRSKGHCAGSLLSMAYQIGDTALFQSAINDIDAAMGYEDE